MRQNLTHIAIVVDDYDKAIQFYNNNDFVEFDQHNFNLGNDVQTDLLMELRIINQANYL